MCWIPPMADPLMSFGDWLQVSKPSVTTYNSSLQIPSIRKRSMSFLAIASITYLNDSWFNLDFSYPF